MIAELFMHKSSLYGNVEDNDDLLKEVLAKKKQNKK